MGLVTGFAKLFVTGLVARGLVDEVKSVMESRRGGDPEQKTEGDKTVRVFPKTGEKEIWAGPNRGWVEPSTYELLKRDKKI